MTSKIFHAEIKAIMASDGAIDLKTKVSDLNQERTMCTLKLVIINIPW